jgi:hypothetical protein
VNNQRYGESQGCTNSVFQIVSKNVQYNLNDERNNTENSHNFDIGDKFEEKLDFVKTWNGDIWFVYEYQLKVITWQMFSKTSSLLQNVTSRIMMNLQDYEISDIWIYEFLNKKYIALVYIEGGTDYEPTLNVQIFDPKSYRKVISIQTEYFGNLNINNFFIPSDLYNGIFYIFDEEWSLSRYTIGLLDDSGTKNWFIS